MANENVNYLKMHSKIKYFTFLVIYFLLYPICKVLYGRRKNWLICERGNDAQDNGFIFYKYLVEKHPEIHVTYIIDSKSPEFQKVKKLGKSVEFCSLKHFMMTIGCPVKISSQLFGYSPWSQMETYLRRRKTRDKHIFLQHGIIKNDHEGLHGDVCNSLSLFVCGAKTEYDFISKTFNYSTSVPQYTGLARYDLLLDCERKNQILIMPTWRAKYINLTDEEFTLTDFYKSWNSLLQNKEFLLECQKRDIKVCFYLHYAFQKYSHLFSSSKIVEVIPFGKYTVQDLLKESSLLITDFSSVYFDFAYMRKPMIFYQFDESTFNQEHYSKGYFDYRKDGFGPVCLQEADVLKYIREYVDNNFAFDEQYRSNLSKCFVYNDTNNCDRIFSAIKVLLNKNEK